MLNLLGLPPEWTDKAFLGFFDDIEQPNPSSNALDRMAKLVQSVERHYGEVKTEDAQRLAGLSRLKAGKVLRALRNDAAPGHLARRRAAYAAQAGRDHRVHRREDRRLRHPVLGIGCDGPVRGAQAQGALSGLAPGDAPPATGRAGRPSPGSQPRKGGTCHTKTPIKNVRAGGGDMNALPPNASPAACVQDAERHGPCRITVCASVAARSGARPSAPGARRPGQPAYFMLAEMPNGAAGARVTGASGATGPGGRLACARVAASNSPLKAARCANPAAR